MYVHSIALVLNFASVASGELKLTINSIKQPFNYTFQLRTTKNFAWQFQPLGWFWLVKSLRNSSMIGWGTRKAAKERERESRSWTIFDKPTQFLSFMRRNMVFSIFAGNNLAYYCTNRGLIDLDKGISYISLRHRRPGTSWNVTSIRH